MDTALLPEAFLANMKEQLGEEYPAFLESYREGRVQGLRKNPLKGDTETFLRRMPFTLAPVPWCEDGYYYQEDERPGKHPYHEAGVYYIQEPSAMAVARLAAARPGERVLDLCAAPGGKSTQLAGDMMGKGLLVANEIIPSRAKILSQNIERLGITNAVVLNHAPEQLADRFFAFFDCIVVDAPCSGEGMFRKNPDACREWSPAQVQLCVERQESILECAARMLAPGGRIVYSTCTFNRQENEEQIERFLSRHPDFALERTERYYPHRQRGEGHFAARLVMNSEKITDVSSQLRSKSGARGRRQKQAEAEKEGFVLYRAFLKEIFPDGMLPDFGAGVFCGESNLQWFGDNLYLVPQGMADFKGLKTERPGLHLGTRKKARFEPSHALALAIRPEMIKRDRIIALPADSPEAEGYLRGMTLSAEKKNGWCLITVDGYSIGWGKASGGVCKNHYPKGLYRS